MSDNPVKNRTRLYSFIAVVLIICLTATILLSYESLSTKPTELNNSGIQPQTTESPTQTSNPTTQTDTNTIRAINGTVIYNLDNAPITYPLTQQSAVKIAIPYIETYAKENNRTILRLNIKQIYVANETKSTMDVAWKVAAEFDDFKDNITSYGVLICVNTGEIRDKGPIEYNISQEQALTIAHSYIDPYVAENHRVIESIKATLSWSITIKAPMGDPRWSVSAYFTDTEDSILSYHVFLNAYDGQVYSEGPEGFPTL